MISRQGKSNLLATLLGLLVTASTVLLYTRGALDWLELKALYWRFQHANTLEPSPQIVCLGIEDDDLETWGRFPWPRDVQAALVSVPAEMGARAVVVDITWDQPEAPAERELALDPAGAPTPPLRGSTESAADRALAAVIARCGSAYLAYHHAGVDLEKSAEFATVVDSLLAGDRTRAAAVGAVLEARLRKLIRVERDARLLQPLTRAKIVVELLRDPALRADELAATLALDPDLLERAYEKCRLEALRRRLLAWLDAHPDAWTRASGELAAAAYSEITGAAWIDDTPLRDAMLRCAEALLSYAATTRDPLAPLERLAPIAQAVDGMTPVYYLHARAARRCCFANVEPDTGDGVILRLALAREHQGRLLAQLAFAAAWDLLGLTPERIELGRGGLTISPAGRPALRIQLDESGRTVIPWVRGRDWTRQFEQRPANFVLALADLRRKLDNNSRTLRDTVGLFASSGAFPEIARAARPWLDLARLQEQIPAAADKGDEATAALLRDMAAGLRPAAERGQQEALQAIDRLAAALETDAAPPEGVERQDVLSAARLAGRLRDANARIARQIVEHEKAAREFFDGKVCVVGYAATSVADMKPSPTHPAAPGMMAHANLLSGLLSGRMVYWAPAWANSLLAAALGALATWVSITQRPRFASVIVTLVAALLLWSAGYVAFARWSYWVAVTPALLALAASYFTIAAYRYIFVDAERRQLSTALVQYTSREIARQVAENPELCQRAEMRDVTAMFTDLRNFTSISEQIGADRTQRVLNICLGRFTEVMLRHEAMVNKFIGDGIFAFWNPVIYPQADHALRACETAVDLIAALAALKREQHSGRGDEVFGELWLRIGVASGSAIVGPCGSEQKFDYTCIGDSVNVAARLESANKFYGTTILVNGAVREQVGERFEFRPLGGVQVKGKRQATPVFELLGRGGQAPADDMEYARTFGEAIASFQQRRWTEALQRFEQCGQRRPDDLAAARYLEATAMLMGRPPNPDWNGAIELSEK